LPLSSVASHSQVMRTRAPLFPETAAEFLCRFPGEQEIAEASHQQAWAFLPLVAADRPIGCCVVAYIRPHHFTFADRALLIALSGLVAHALERARLYDSAHRRAQELQNGLLPGAPPHLAFADLAVRYRSATRHAEVGGDWYDAIPLSAGRFALVVGDVMGQGIAEAATMGRIRTAIRTLAELELTPAEVLTQVNALVAEFGDGKYAGCLYIVVDPVSRRCSICRAGHLPALIVFPDGTVRPLSAEANPPLGVGEPPLEASEVQLPEESFLVLYTNGLIDAARSDVDQGLVALEGVLREEVMRRGFPGLGTGASRQPLTELCQAVMDAMLPNPEQMTDDAALVIAHVHGTPTDDVGSRSLKQDATAAREARGYAHEQLTEWGLEELIDETELIVSELVGNAIKYATGPIRLRLIRSDSLICEVYDGSLTTPHIRRAADTDEGGRGLQLVAALSERWGARYLDDGKCIWAEQGLSSRV
jgi:serine phosphatase RsbU (regulator of sigma subunit)/anti-sigma regulatory factor (Ser/Thr protein kinase)